MSYQKEIVLLKCGELVLKGQNRSTFEDAMMKNARRRLEGLGKFHIWKSQSTVYVEPATDVEMDRVVERLQTVFGVVALCPARVVAKDWQAICAAAPDYLARDLAGAKTFKVNAKRSDKRFPMDSPAICRELEQVPPEAWFRDYPGTMKRLEKLNCTVPAFLNAREAAFRLEKNRKTAELLGESFRACKASSIRTCLEAWRACADDPSLSVEERQLILLSMVHPLWVRLEEVLYREAHTPESEDAFNQAVAVLEEVRDMNRSSVCGRRAHQLREELRRARLAAARYD